MLLYSGSGSTVAIQRGFFFLFLAGYSFYYRDICIAVLKKLYINVNAVIKFVKKVQAKREIFT